LTVQEVIDLAVAGELRQLGPSIKSDNDVLVGFINLGLIELYKRFQLRTEEAMITLQDGKTIYSLDGTDPDVTLSGGDVMTIVAAFGDGSDPSDYSTDDLKLPLNVEMNAYSINTIGYNQVQIPLITQSAMISLIYVAFPAKASSAALDAELDIPDQFVEPLLHYMGYRGHGSMDGEVQAENNTHYMRFEAACDRIRELGVSVATDDLNMDSRVYDRGFV
jgi:hypothetical protein